MAPNDSARRAALRTLLLGTAGLAVTACGSRESAPTSGATSAPATPAPAPPAAAPSAAPAPAAVAGAAGAAVDPGEPQARALHYVLDATTVDAKVQTSYRPGQHCASCIHYQGAADAPQAPCAIFAGRTVVGPGWCQVWAQKPA